MSQTVPFFHVYLSAFPSKTPLIWDAAYFPLLAAVKPA